MSTLSCGRVCVCALQNCSPGNTHPPTGQEQSKPLEMEEWGVGMGRAGPWYGAKLTHSGWWLAGGMQSWGKWE